VQSLWHQGFPGEMQRGGSGRPELLRLGLPKKEPFLAIEGV
jgi:hypothetical protein